MIIHEYNYSALQAVWTDLGKPTLSEGVKASLKPQDLLLTMGAGDVYTIGENILAENKV